ncbi:type VI secretion system Vgr family protein [Chitinophagaceae bacterium LWZ2-11]
MYIDLRNKPGYLSDPMKDETTIPGVTLEITIEGKAYHSFHTFHLEQSCKDHHKFAIKMDRREELITCRNLDLYMEEFLGKRFSVVFLYMGRPVTGDPNGESFFQGVITSVCFERHAKEDGLIVLEGYSPTYILDQAPHTQIFNTVNTAFIADKILETGLKKVNTPYELNVQYETSVVFSMQYQETHHNYLKRLAANYGEWYFYNGFKIFFGKPYDTEKPIKLIYGRDTHNLRMSGNVKYFFQHYYNYDSYINKTWKSSGETDAFDVDLPVNISADLSGDLLLTDSVNISPVRPDTEKTMDVSLRGATNRAAADMLTIEGETCIPFLQPGRHIELNVHEWDEIDKMVMTNSVTKFMITEVTHELNNIGQYVGKFKGISFNSRQLPIGDYHKPIAMPQVATVLRNNDPQGVGRVQVRFDWPGNNNVTDWIRVMTPDAGNSNAVPTNRGHVFIPEENDRVIVGFEDGHPDRPYVMGSVFNGDTGRGGGTGNNIKSIYTRTGISIVLNDGDGKGSVTIKDPSGNRWYMDGAGSITVDAPETFTVNAKNMNVNVTENLNTTVGMNSTERIGGNKTVQVVSNYSITAFNIIEMASGGKRSEAEKISEQAKAINKNAQGKSVNIHGKENVHANSGEKSMLN